MDDVLLRLQTAVGDAYHIERELGGGGMSRLFLARERALDRPVVLKLLPPDLADPVTAERFRREVRMIARLQHPHIVSVLGTGSADGLAWYTMPYVAGESLRHRLEGGPLPLHEALRIVGEVADALVHAHREGVIHRDIKPANILLEAGHAVVADFGIAHATSAAADGLPNSRLTATGASIGTIGYMAPEQIAAESLADARSDVYSLAVVAYQLLTGRLPFQGSSGAQVLAAQVRDTPPSPRSLRAEVPSAVSDVIMRGIAQSPDERPQSAGAFAAPFLRARTGAPRGRRVAVAAAAGVVAVVAGAVWLRSTLAAPSPLGEDTIVVAPFNVLVPELALWGEGLVDVLLSRSLDGMGPIRTVAPSVAVRAWSGRADPGSADALARQTGARLVLFGTLQPSGGDSVRAVATLYDAAAGKAVYDWESREGVDRMDRLADSLTVTAVRFLASDRSLALTPRASTVGSRSIAAIKEFLQGEQLQRAGAFDSATVHYRRAIELDSTFALAHWGLANSHNWDTQRTPEDLAHFMVAGALNVGLAPRDSLLVLYDSILTANTALAADPNGPDPITLPGRRRAVLATLTARYPDAAAGWFRLGEDLFHRALLSAEPATAAETADAFERAIEADSGYSEAYIHAIDIANVRGRRDDAMRQASALARQARGSELGIGAAWLEWFLRPPGRTDTELRELVDTLSTPAPLGGFVLLLGERWIDSTASAARLLKAAVGSGRTVPGLATSTSPSELAARAFAFHGQLASARSMNPVLAATDVAALARLGVVDADSVAELLRDGALAPRDDVEALRLLPFWAWRRDSTSVVALRERLAARPAAPTARGRRLQAYEVRVTIVFLGLARADTTSALRELDGMPGQVQGFEWPTWRRILAPVLAARGRLEEAVRFVGAGSLPLFGTNSVEDAEYLLNGGRVAERAGNAAVAREYYGALATAWAHADPEFAPLVAEVEGALDRLASARP